MSLCLFLDIASAFLFAFCRILTAFRVWLPLVFPCPQFSAPLLLLTEIQTCSFITLQVSGVQHPMWLFATVKAVRNCVLFRVSHGSSHSSSLLWIVNCVCAGFFLESSLYTVRAAVIWTMQEAIRTELRVPARRHDEMQCKTPNDSQRHLVEVLPWTAVSAGSLLCCVSISSVRGLGRCQSCHQYPLPRTLQLRALNLRVTFANNSAGNRRCLSSA